MTLAEDSTKGAVGGICDKEELTREIWEIEKNVRCNQVLDFVKLINEGGVPGNFSRGLDEVIERL